MQYFRVLFVTVSLFLLLVDFSFAAPLLGVCNFPKVRVRSTPSIKSSHVIGTLNEGEEIFILEEKVLPEADYPWFQIQSVKRGRKGWVYGEFIKVLPVQVSPTQQMAWQMLLDYGNTPSQARSIFGKPEKEKERALDGGKKEKILFFVTHQAVFIDDMLARIIVEKEQKGRFGRFVLGLPETDLLELSRRYIVDHDSLIFLSDEFDEFRFDIQFGKISRMVFRRAVVDDTFLPAWVNK